MYNGGCGADMLYPPPNVNWYPGAAEQLSSQHQDNQHQGNQNQGYQHQGNQHHGNQHQGNQHQGNQQRSNGTFESQQQSFTPAPQGMPAQGLPYANQTFERIEYAQSSEYARPSNLPIAASFFSNAASCGFSTEAPPAPAARIPQSPPAAQRNVAEPSLVVNVDSALDLTPSDRFGTHDYCATAHYVGEPQAEIESRRTQAVKAHPSSTSPSKENVVLHQRISVPYNSRQQFLMVSIYEADPLGDSFVGQATVPLAEHRLSSTSPWTLIRDGIETGTVTLNVQLPGANPTPVTPVPEPQQPQQAPRGPSSQVGGPYGPSPQAAGNPYGPSPSYPAQETRQPGQPDPALRHHTGQDPNLGFQGPGGHQGVASFTPPPVGPSGTYPSANHGSYPMHGQPGQPGHSGQPDMIPGGPAAGLQPPAPLAPLFSGMPGGMPGLTASAMPGMNFPMLGPQIGPAPLSSQPMGAGYGAQASQPMGMQAFPGFGSQPFGAALGTQGTPSALGSQTMGMQSIGRPPSYGSAPGRPMAVGSQAQAQGYQPQVNAFATQPPGGFQFR